MTVVGGGYTGLWTAYYLLEIDPALDVVVLEAEHVGFGASGRNGGWVSVSYTHLDVYKRKPLRRDHSRAF